MLQSLRIRNLAIVEDVRVECGPGLNVITGETGAGKSVIVGALNLLLGDRADKSLLRAGAEQCAVEALFTATNLREALEELGLDAGDDGQLIIRRQFTAAGTGKVLINDSPATVQALKRLGDLLVDMHGPHDHQSLLSREFNSTCSMRSATTTPHRTAARTGNGLICNSNARRSIPLPAATWRSRSSSSRFRSRRSPTPSSTVSTRSS